tara:strand:+ start:532 stop:1377 length:846 start_codon:yes stop_codon:yes gene_type:complete
LGEALDDYYAAGIQAISTVGLAFSAAAIGDEFSHAIGVETYKSAIETAGIGGLFFFGFLAGYSIFLSEKEKRRASLLEKAVESEKDVQDQLAERLALYESNLENLIDGYLYHFATQRLCFGSGAGNTDRISLYLHDHEQKCFYRLGRYSANPDYRKSDKGPYETHRGCIYEAWKDDWFFDGSFPDPKRKQDYQRRQTEFSITNKMVKKFAMLPRMYCGCAIKSESGTENIAVLVIESTLHDKFTEQELQDALHTDGAFHTELAVRAKALYAKPSYVRSKGF